MMYFSSILQRIHEFIKAKNQYFLCSTGSVGPRNKSSRMLAIKINNRSTHHTKSPDPANKSDVRNRAVKMRP
jgi:hypothetical protein